MVGIPGVGWSSSRPGGAHRPAGPISPAVRPGLTTAVNTPLTALMERHCIRKQTRSVCLGISPAQKHELADREDNGFWPEGVLPLHKWTAAPNAGAILAQCRANVRSGARAGGGTSRVLRMWCLIVDMTILVVASALMGEASQ